MENTKEKLSELQNNLNMYNEQYEEAEKIYNEAVQNLKILKQNMENIRRERKRLTTQYIYFSLSSSNPRDCINENNAMYYM